MRKETIRSAYIIRAISSQVDSSRAIPSQALRSSRLLSEVRIMRSTLAAFTSFAAAVALLVLLPAASFAQSSIAGVVKDDSGGVLPGVTVEAASPALIERTRSVVSDGQGQFKIV